jgi:hypothetical protein
VKLLQKLGSGDDDAAGLETPAVLETAQQRRNALTTARRRGNKNYQRARR